MKNHLYLISGLGADERVFSKLHFPDIPFTFLQWLTPEKGERIEAYAKRMCAQVQTDPLPAGRPILTGVSFGGMMAIEMAKHLPGAAVILISSVGSYKELPSWTRLAGALGLYKLIPSRQPSWMRSIGNRFLGAESAEEIRLADEFMKHVDPIYLHWAIGQIVHWQNDWRPQLFYHIHGSHDRTFPLSKVAATHVIQGGGHFMVMNRADEISELLTRVLAGLSICQYR